MLLLTGKICYDSFSRGKTPIIKNVLPGRYPLQKNKIKGSDIIPKTIQVVDCDGTPLKPTYIKRARQLVKKCRAEWLSEDVVRMKPQDPMEEVVMETESIASATTDAAANQADKDILNHPNQPVIDDEIIMDMAKRRLADKRNLTGQVIDYLLILLCLFMIVMDWDNGEKLFIGFVFSMFWGIRLLYRAIKFAQPAFKDGIAAYLKKRNDNWIESEFNRLKKEYLNNN